MLKSKDHSFDPKTFEVLKLLATGSILIASVIVPGLPIAAGALLKIKKNIDYENSRKEWEKFNLWRLKQVLKRMQNSKYVEIVTQRGVPVVKITDKGKEKLLKYDLQNLQLDQSKWDGRWRLIIYDVGKDKKRQVDTFRRTLNNLKVLRLQRSVYLTPFKCEDEIEYLKQVFDLDEEVQVLLIRSLDNESTYKKYFGLN
ncbi:MAG TPA: hypothetical protein VIK81_01395 [Patescibacteria group bacterium]